MELKLYYPVKNPINQSNLFGTSNAMYAGLGQKGHPGLDFEAPLGTPLYAPCDGDAFYATDSAGGDGFWIRYPSNAAPQYNIILWHMPNAGNPTYPSTIPETKGVVTGIKAGELLGYTGNSGFPVESTGPHLHVGVLPCDATGAALNPDNGYLGCVDPMPFFNELFAEDINKVQPVVTQLETVAIEVGNSNLPTATKLSFYKWVAQFLNSLFFKQ